MELWIIACQAFWFIAPAYAANAFPPLVKGKRPLDFGKYFGKYRLLGDGKTFEGSIAGIVFGVFIGLVLLYFQSDVQTVATQYGFVLPTLTIPLISLLSTGAIVGDITGAFIKRRFGIKRGNPAPLLDQLDFIFGSIGFASLMYVPSWEVILFLVVITPIIHWIANIIGYFSGVKRTPW